MKTKLRKLLALLMTLAMFISSVPTTALAAVVPYPGGTDTGSGISLRSIVKPPVATTTYVFMNGDTEFARQIVKNGETLNNPGTPDAGSPNREFTGWRDGENNAPVFGAVTVTETKTITYHAQFADVYFVFFTNEKGEVMVTKKGANGDTISTEGVTYPVGNEQSIVGWEDASGNLVSSVTLNGSDVTLTARVENGHWITYDSQGGTYVAPAFVKGNGTTTAPENPTRPGYTFHHWSATVGGAAFTFGNALTTALTLYAVWTPNTRTQYTVIHWQENADDDEYSYAESETKYGTTGAQTSAAAKSYTGFTAQTIAQQTIAGDGSTIVNVYYKRNVYNVQFYERKSNRWQEIPNLKITAKYQAFIGDKWPTYNGSSTWSTTSNYSWSSGLQGPYQVNIETMPLNGASFYGPKAGYGSESAHYYVEVLPGESGETVSGVTYKLHHTDTSPGTGYTVTVEDQYPITGFTFNSSPSTKIKDDYDNAKFYYTRNSYNIVYVSGGQTVNTASKKFEESIADAGSYTPTVKPAGMEDYDFGGWHADPAGEQAYTFTGKTMPAQNVTVYAKWNKPVYNGTIYLTIEGTGSSIILSVPKGDTIETALNEKQAEIMAQVGEGFTWRGWRTGKDGTGEPFNPQTQITTDVTLYPYYTKDGTFTVEYVSGKNDVTAPVDGKSYAEDSFADLMSPGKLVAADGEYFLGWSDGAATYQPRDKYQIKSNHANDQNVITLTAQWGARPAGTTLTYKANGGAGADVVENLANNATVTTRPGTTFSRVGYTFKGWDTDPKGEGSIAPNTQVQVDNNGANVLYAIWTANADTKYTVEFYYQNVDGTYTLNHSDKRTATTDTTVSVTEADKAAKENNKYVFEADNKNNVLSGNVAGNGSLVLKLYFKLNTASYTIHHYLNGTTVKVADDQTGAKTIGETLTANKSDALYPAYAAAEVASYAPSQTITIAADESENVITVYYTMPLTIKAKDASKTYDGQPLTQPDFTMKGLVNGDTKDSFSLSMTAASTITNAGNTPNVIDRDTVKYNGDKIPSYYSVSYEPGTLTVNKASATVTITGVNETHVYDGRQHEANGYNYSINGKPNEITISLKPNVLAIARRTDVGTTYMGLTKDSFTVTSANYDVTIKAVNDGYVTITPVTDKVTVTVTENGAIVTYDGTEHSVKGYKSMTADNALYDVTTSVKATETAAWTAKGTNAGEYPVGIAAGDFENINKNFKNVTFKVVDDVLKINPITENTITITANSNEKTYDGTPLTDGGFTFTPGVLVDGDELTAVVEGSATNVGDEGKNVVKSYKVMRGDVDVTGNYTFGNSIDGSLTINKRTVTLTSETASKEYDGTPLTKPVVAVTGDGFVAGEVTDVKATGSVTFVHEGEVTNAITYTEGAKFKETNYTISKNEGKLSITKREGEGKTITVTANNDEKVYNGAPLTNNGFTHAGALVEGDVLTAVVEGSQTDVGSSDNVVTSYRVMRGETDVTTSYTFTESGKGALTVTARAVTFTGESKSLPYTGGMQSITGITQSGLVEGHRYEDLTYKAEGQNVGSYDGAFSGDVVIKDAQGNDVTKNYKVTKTPGKLTITNASFTVTFTGESDTKVYNGSEQSITGITVDGLKTGHRYEGLTYAAKGTDKGEYVGAFTGTVKILDENNVDVTENYAVTQTPGTLTITAYTTEVVVTISGGTDTVTYDGSEHSVNGYEIDSIQIDGKDTTLYTVNDFKFTGTAKATGTNADKYEMGLKESDFQNTSKNFTNVKFIVNDGELVINKRLVKVTAERLEYAYDYENPAAHPADGVARYTVEAANGDRGLLAGDTLNADVLYDGQSTQTLIGVYQAVAQIAAAKITNDNGDVTDNYTIEKVDSTLTIKGNDPIDPGKETTSVQTNYTVGDVIEYKITVKNVSRDEATNVVVTDSMAEIQDSVGYTVSEDRHTATIASIPAGGTVLVYARHTVTAEDVENAYAGDANGSLTNVANIKFGDWNKDVEGDHDELNDTYEYVVRYYWNNYTSVQPHEEKKLTARVGTEVTEKPAAIEGYTPVSADSRKLTISADQSKNVIEFYYYKNVELTANSETYTYDGAEKQVNGFTIKGENKDQDDQTIAADFSAITVGAKGVDAGEYPANFAENTVGAVDKTGRYIVAAANNGKLVINPVTGQLITITANSNEKTYDGTPLTDNGFTFTQGVLADGDELTAVVEGSATNVGDEGRNVVKSYAVKRGETDVTKNYTFGNSIDGKLTINKRTVTLKSETASKEYDGTPLTKPVVTVSGDGFVAGEVTGITATGSVTFVHEGEVTNTITFTTGEKFKETNYTISKEEGKLSITRREGEGKTITVTANSDEKVYDGAPLTNNGFTHAGALVEGDVLIAVVEGSQTDVGSSDNVVTSYRVMRGETDVTTSYTFGKSIIGTLTVTPVAIELTAASASKAYDGTPLTNSNYTITKGAFVDGEGLATVTIAGSQTLVGASANTITGHTLKDNTLAQNYTITYQPGELKVTQNEKAITITANSHTWEYNGQPHSDGGYTVEYDGQTYKVEAGKTATLPTGDVVKAKITKTVTNVSDSAANNNQIDELTIVNAAGEDTKGQYKTVTLIPGTLTITKRGAGEDKVKITAADNTVEYDGKPHGAKLNAAGQIELGTSYTVTNLAEGHSVKTLAIEGSETDAGVYADKLVPGNAVIVDRSGVEVTANYDITYVPGALTITRRGAGDMKVELTAANNTVVYDGQPHGAKLNAAGEIEVGTSYTITNLADGHKVQSVVISGSETAVGEYENRLVPSGAKIVDAEGNDVTRNYVVGYKNGKLTITSPDTVIVTIRGNKDTVEYNGQKHEVNGYEVVSISNTLYTKDDFGLKDGAAAHAEGTDAGDYFMNLTKDSFVNRNGNFSAVTFVVEDGKLTITKRGLDKEKLVKITAADNSVFYDGQPHGAKLNAAGQIEVGTSYTTEYLAPGHKVQTVAIDGSETMVGVYENRLVPNAAIIVDENDNDVTTNYVITYVPGTLEIRKNETEIKVTANSHTWEYDGQPHTDGGYTVNYDGVDYPVAAGDFATLPTGDEVTATVEGTVTNVADSADDNNVVTNVIITNKAGTVVNDQYKTITRVNGGLKITKRGDSEDEDKKVKIIAEPNTVEYDGSAHGAKLNANGEIELGTSYTTVRLVDGHYVDETTLDITGSQTNVGVYEEELKPAVKAGATRIVIRDKDGNDVTDNYALTLVNATLTITGDKLIPDKKAEDENIESNYKLGDEIEFTITVKNVSIYDVENVEVVDRNAEIQAGDGYTVSADKHTATIASIAAKSEIRIKALHTVTSEDILAGKVGNVANVEWKDGEKTVTKTVDDDTTKLTPPDVTLNVTKTSDWEGSNDKKVPPEVGTKITYTITVTNTGNVPATNVRFKDVLQENKATVTGDIPTYGTLGVGEENKESFTVEYIVTEADLLKGSILNEVFANADEINYTYYVEEDGKEVAKPGTKTVKEAEAFVEDTTVQASASFTSTKTTTSTPKNEKGYALGETITYEIKVTNDGNLTLTDVEVTEKLAGAVIKASSDYTVSGSVATIAELKPGQTVIVNVEYVVTEADILAGSVKNVATVKGNGPDDKDPDPKEPGTEDPTDKPKATLNIAKSVVSTPKNGTSYKLGETITYKLTVKVGADNNLTVKNIKVTDTLLTAENVNAKIVEIAGGYTLNENNEIELPDMAPGATEVVITYTYTVQESDLGSGAYGSVYNAATTKGITPDGQEPKKDTETNTPTNIRLIITAKPNTGIEYDGDAHGENGYDATGLATGHEITSVTISGSRTNVGYYPEELDPSDAVIMEGNVDVTSHYEITYVKGDLEIIKRGLDEKNPVQIIAKSNTVGYDGKAHGAKLNAKGEIELGTSYTTARLVDGHYVDETTLDITGSQTNVGVYEEELKPAVKAGATRIVIRDKDGNDVTDNYALTLVNATLTITGDKLIPDKKAEDENIESNYKLGDEIEFTITVKNVSIYDVENVEVVDRNAEIQAGDGYTVSADKHTATIASIAAKSEIRIKALHTVTSEDILAGKVGNVANVEWKDGEKTVTKTVDDDTTKLTPPDVTLNVTKTSDWEGSNDKKVPPEVGTKITYTITVTNTGNVPATNVRFKDVLQENKATVTGDIPTYGTLGVGEENKESFTVEYIVTEADLLKGSILNEVFANADEINYTYYVEEDGKEVAKPGTKTVKEAEAFVEDTTVQASASFTSTKTTTSTPKNEKGYALGETITYEIKVTNDGNLTLTDVEVTEKLAGAVIKASSDYTVSGSVATIAELKPGQTVIVNVEYVVTEADILAGSVKNVATVKGNGPDDKDPDPKEPGTEDPTDKPKATLNIAKSVVSTPKNGTSYKLGEKITYKLTVRVGADNNVTVKNIRVTDTLLTAENVNAKIVEIAGGYTLNATGEIELPDMAPGAADVVITYTYMVQESDLGSGAYGSVHNAAVSKGATPDPDPENPNPKPVNPKDEDKKDAPTNIRLVITANNNTGIVYDGEEHGEDGYKQTGLSKDHTIEKVAISGKRTNVGEEKLVPSDAKIVDKAGNDVTSHYDIEYVNATLEIIQKKLTITADSDEKFYDETPLTKDSYTNTELAEGDEIANVTITGTITEVGSVENVASGAKIVNAAGEDVTGNYDIEYVKGTLTIKAIPSDGFVDVTITKKWDDANNQDGKRDDVTLTLNASANGRLIDWDVLKDIAKNGANLTMDETAEHVFARAEFTDDKDSYSYTFRNVPKYANFNDVNTLIDFAVTENEVPDFYEIDVESSTRLMIVNVHEVKTMNIHVTKVWEDENNNDGYRPDAITVKLYADGALYGEKTITPDENDVWETTFENLPVYKKGETISYTVEEDAIDEYTTTYSTEKPIVGGDYDEVAREVTITNRYEIKKMNIKVIKIWADSDNEDKLRPNALSFDLYKTVGGGERELVLQFQLRSSTGTSVWKYKDLRTTIGGLNVYENGEKIHYSIEETTVIEGYTVKYIDNDIVGGNKVNDQYQTDFMTWVTNYHIIKRPNRLIGPMGMTSGECVE